MLTPEASAAESLGALRTLHSTLQSSHSTLEASLQEATTSSRTSLLRIQTLTSTVTSLEADKAFLTSELERGRNEWSTYRREKHEELIRVQSQLENNEIEARSNKSSLEALRTAHEQLKTRHNETLEALAKAREELEANEGNFTGEMTSMKRLVEMLEKREDDRKKRIEEVERGLEEERASYQEREDAVREELQAERERSDQLEVRYAEMREALERGTTGGAFAREELIGGSPSPAGSSFALSPSAQMAVRGQKSGRSYAEVYGEYVRMEEELVRERAETKRLSDCLSQILTDIEERVRCEPVSDLYVTTTDSLLCSCAQAPLLKEQRAEYERLSLESTQLAAQLAQAAADRDNADRRSEAYRLDVDRFERENTTLSHQLRDLGRQVRTLMRSIASKDIAGNADDFDEEEESIRKRAEVDSTTDAVVSAHLVTFQTVNELQVQNQKLLRITREMGAQMERGEEDAIGRRRYEENKAVEEAHELILRLKDEVESQRAKTDAFERERDMFRRMLAQRGGDSSAVVGVGALVERNGSTSSGAEGGDHSRLLADVQANFDAYKSEIAVDSQRLREDLKDAQQAANAARTELAKSKAQSEFLSGTFRRLSFELGLLTHSSRTERFRLLTESYELQSGEMSQLSKRSVQLQQNVAKQELTTHKVR